MTAKHATTGWPVDIPPRIPPAWFDKNLGAPSPVGIGFAGKSRAKLKIK